ncbi:hypothetical protein BGX21_008875 [Mortierella sp. AD011]|nr:hypothetical protein BGX20_007941 [Mortierella sp. AD010]KAF9397434.1 hypothetical protein BGX21_008875 [Mortierella sp. AD011]
MSHNCLMRNIAPWNAVQIRPTSIAQHNPVLHSRITPTASSLTSRQSRSISLNWPRQSNASLNPIPLDQQSSSPPPPPPPTVAHPPSLTPNPSHAPTPVSNLRRSGTTTASSVRFRIHSPVNKQKNYSQWTSETDNQLLSLRSQGKTWIEIGKILGRSRQACNKRYDAILCPESGAPFWEKYPEKIQILQDLRAQGWGWPVIALQVGTKASSCERQWKKVERDRLTALATTTTTATTIDEAAETLEATTDHMKPILRFKSSHVPLLKDAVAKYGTNQWETISIEVFKSMITPEYLKHHYLKLERKRKSWTDRQNEQLINAVQNICSKNKINLVESNPVRPAVPTTKEEVTAATITMPISLTRIDDILNESHWEDVAESIPGHTASECRERWIRLRAWESGLSRIFARNSGENKLNTNSSHENDSSQPLERQQRRSSKSTTECSSERYIRWTPEQTQRLETSVKTAKDSSDWNHRGWENVATLMDSEFTKEQCKARWFRLQREIKSTRSNNTNGGQGGGDGDGGGRWGRDEIEDLIKGVHEFGFDWMKIKQKWVQGRTGSLCQGKWTRVKTKLNLEMAVRKCSWRQVCRDIYGPEIGRMLDELPERWPSICDMPVKKKKDVDGK